MSKRVRVTDIPDRFPLGDCQCGCGQKTPVAPRTNRNVGQIKGVPLRYIHGHSRRLAISSVVEDRGYKTPCVVWLGCKDKDGYGVATLDGRKVAAHRKAYIEIHGAIPKELQIDHLCRQHDCINPDHIEAVAPAVNTRRGNLARLESEEVAKIRALAPSVPGSTLASQFGVTRNHIYAIKGHRRWAT